jgi:hypothetical protein
VRKDRSNQLLALLAPSTPTLEQAQSLIVKIAPQDTHALHQAKALLMALVHQGITVPQAQASQHNSHALVAPILIATT